MAIYDKEAAIKANNLFGFLERGKPGGSPRPVSPNDGAEEVWMAWVGPVLGRCEKMNRQVHPISERNRLHGSARVSIMLFFFFWHSRAIFQEKQKFK